MNNHIAPNSWNMDHHAKIAHDINSPLNIILSSSAMLRIKAETLSEGRDLFCQYIHYIEQSCQRLLRLSNSLMSPDPQNSSLPILQTSLCCIETFLKHTLKDLSVYTSQFGVELHLKSELSNPVLLHFDRDLIERLLWNLVTNALKHTSRSDIISIHLYSDEDFVYINFSDSGEGISSLLLSDIFEPRVTDDRILKNNIFSHGFGLPIVRELAELHKGAVSVSSSPDCGASFTFSISRHLPLTMGSPAVSPL